MKTITKRRELYISRFYAVSRQQVYRAWVDSKHLARWWGPKDFTTPVCEIEARSGGRVRIVMRGPDGSDYPMQGSVTESRANERFGFDYEALDQAGKPVLNGRLSVDFADEDGKTRMSLSVYAEGLGPDAAEKLEGMETGWNQSLDRLARSLHSLTQERS
ncbi:MAG: SRPBCC domain-containing protein [Gammaproteobacteria bacterium]